MAPRVPGEAFTSADRRLLEDLARQAGAAVQAVRLTADLQRSRERLVAAREEERRRMRRNLHDGLGPTLAGLTFGLDAARSLLVREPENAEALLGELRNQTQGAVSEIRRLVYDLRPPALDDLGLVAAIREQAARHGHLLGNDSSDEARGVGREDGLTFSVEAPEHLPPLPAAVEVACYRIAQEALTNVARHAQARACRVRLSIDGGGDTLELEVADDGVGVAEGRRAGVGLSSMRERAAELGGTYVVTPASSSGGTRVLAWLPLPAGGITCTQEDYRGPYPHPDSRRPRHLPLRDSRHAGFRPRVRGGGGGGHGEEAVSQTAQLRPDVVLMDIQMPGLNGIEATRRILQVNPGVGVVVVTMFEEDESVFAAMRAGARGYVLKGADQEEVLKVVDAVANGEAHFGPEITKRLMGFFSAPKPSAPSEAFPELTAREREVLDLIARARSNQQIARHLFVSPKTVRNHISNIFAKLRVADRTQAIVRAREAGLGRDDP